MLMSKSNTIGISIKINSVVHYYYSAKYHNNYYNPSDKATFLCPNVVNPHLGHRQGAGSIATLLIVDFQQARILVVEGGIALADSEFIQALVNVDSLAVGGAAVE